LVKWCAVNTKPRNEDLAAKHLEFKGIEVFLPKIEITRKKGSSKMKRIEPLFPGYLFVKVPLAFESVGKVGWTPGVRRLLCSGDLPVAVPDEVVALIRERIGPRDHLTPRPEEEFPVGTGVAVRFGPFAGLLGLVERPISARGRVKVLLQLLHGVMSVECYAVDLDRLPEDRAGTVV
jgi:transcriptional antiterminator RfaH